MSPRTRSHWLVAVASLTALLSASYIEAAFLTLATTRLVTNSTGGKNQDPAIDKGANLIVFTSNVDHQRLSGDTFGPTETFDFNEAGNAFTLAGATHPNPACANCSADTYVAAAGNLYLWRQKKKGAEPANSVKQLTFSDSGGFAANQKPDINQKGTYVAWDSDADHVATNADGNREIFVMELATGAITQATNTTGSASANLNASLSSDAKVVVFQSNRDFAAASCKLPDGVTACDNGDNNAEVMIWRRLTNDFVQLTQTTGGSSSANIRPRVSDDGRYVGFQTTRDPGVQLPPGTTCLQLDGVSACSNADGNGEIMLFDTKKNVFTQITATTPSPACSGTTANERVEISTRGNYLSWQSTCENQLNGAGCGDCNGNDEVFLASVKKKSIQQVTISDAGYNRVPRVSANGAYVVFESSRSYKTQNPSHGRTVYLIKRSTAKAPVGKTSQGQVIEDATSPLVQNEKTQLTGTAITGGFNSSVEQFGVSFNGRYFTFDNQKLVGNQEIWFIDARK